MGERNTIYHMGGMIESSLTDFGERLGAARKAAGLSQEDLAEGLGLKRKPGQTQVSRWETGTEIPKGETLMKIRSLVECDGHWLLTGEGDPTLKKDVTWKLAAMEKILEAREPSDPEILRVLGHVGPDDKTNTE